MCRIAFVPPTVRHILVFPYPGRSGRFRLSCNTASGATCGLRCLSNVLRRPWLSDGRPSGFLTSASARKSTSCTNPELLVNQRIRISSDIVLHGPHSSNLAVRHNTVCRGVLFLPNLNVVNEHSVEGISSVSPFGTHTWSENPQLMQGVDPPRSVIQRRRLPGLPHNLPVHFIVRRGRTFSRLGSENA